VVSGEPHEETEREEQISQHLKTHQNQVCSGHMLRDRERDIKLEKYSDQEIEIQSENKRDRETERKERERESIN